MDRDQELRLSALGLAVDIYKSSVAKSVVASDVVQWAEAFYGFLTKGTTEVPKA